MPERTLNQPLSGAEIVEAVLDKLREHLRRQCFLSPNTAYDKFSGHIIIDLRCHDIGRVDEVHVDVPVPPVTVNPPSDDDQFLNDTIDIPEANPNDVRVETGQPVPTLARGSDGKEEIKGVKYSRKSAPIETGVAATTAPESPSRRR